MIWPTVMRGLSEANGSWKTVRMSRQGGLQLGCRSAGARSIVCPSRSV